MIEVREIRGRNDLRKFIDIPWSIYRDDPNWVPPLRGSLLKTLMGVNNPLFMCGPHTFFMAYKDGAPAGRLLAGINEKLNREKEKKEGYISLFESIEVEEAAFALLDRACGWLRERGMETVVGPVSPTNGDDSRGLLIEGFDGPPVLMNSYNPSYYPDMFEKYGFVKNMDLLAYYLDPMAAPIERFQRVVEYAMNKYRFRVDRFDFKNLEREVMDMKKILDEAMPRAWGHLTPPSVEELRAEVNSLKKYADNDLLYIARSGDEPIGFVFALPDLNEVLMKLNGRLFPLGVFKYLWYKGRVSGLRVFVQFVVPSFHNKAVNSAIFLKLMKEARRKGYTRCEGSTIAEMNIESRRSVEGAGGRLYRTYRIYKKQL
jgi:GNAT superfamily N-acetyltransferase